MVRISLHKDGIDYVVTFEEIVEFDESMEYTAIETKFYKAALFEERAQTVWNMLMPKDVLRHGKFPYYAWEDKYEKMAENLLEGYMMYGVFN